MNCKAIAAKVLAELTHSEVEMALWNCPQLRKEGPSFRAHNDHLLDIGCSQKRNVMWKEALFN